MAGLLRVVAENVVTDTQTKYYNPLAHARRGLTTYNAPRQAIDITEEVNGESLWSVAPSQSLESLKWDTRSARHKLHR